MGIIKRNFANNILSSGTFDATKLTGDIPAGNLSANAPAFDDNKIVNDLSTLGLRVHTQENLNASNTNSQFVDVFNDASGIDTTTNVQRNASEYVSSSSSSTVNGIIPVANGTPFVVNETVGSSNDVATAFNGQADANGIRGVNTNVPLYVGIDYGSARVVDSVVVKSPTDISFYRNASNVETDATMEWQGSNDGSSYTTIDNVATGTSLNASVSMTNSSSTAYRYHRIYIPSNETGSDKQLSEIEFTGDYIVTTVNATGNFTGTTITAPSSVSEMGAIITYQDNAGTNALNTDIVLELSADNGSNWSTATLLSLIHI